MKLKSLLIYSLCLLFQIQLFANTDPEYKYISIDELKQEYANLNIEFKSDLKLSSSDKIAVLISPCRDAKPCQAALSQARRDAQRAANECCCVRFYGVVCCEPNGGFLLAIDAIAVPNNNCN